MERKPDLENELGMVLRFGVMLAAAVAAIGGILTLLRHGLDVPSYGAFHSESAEFRSVPGILAAAAGFRPRAIVQLGLLLLIATPITRVALAGFVFLKNRDWVYVAVSSFVLALLLFGLVTGK
jgi:uncharacterized membrane protein